MSDKVQYVTDENGGRTAVLMGIEDYEKLMEDLADLAVAAERRNEPTIKHDKFMAELKKDGLLPD
jgi:hypothetical protein